MWRGLQSAYAVYVNRTEQFFVAESLRKSIYNGLWQMICIDKMSDAEEEQSATVNTQNQQQNGDRIDQLADMLAKAIESMTRLSVENNELNKKVLNLTTQTLNREDSYHHLH